MRVNRVRVNPKCRSCALIEVCVRIEACESEVSLVCVSKSSGGTQAARCGKPSGVASRAVERKQSGVASRAEVCLCVFNAVVPIQRV